MNAPATAWDGGESYEPIAIVGMGCRLPGGVGSPREFWDLLLDGRDAVTPMPEQRWADHATADDAALLRGAARHGGFLDDVAGFDAEFFGVLPREAELMDPQQRILLEVTWEALEHAGIPAPDLAGTDASVYIGAVSDDYERRLLEDLPGIEAWTGICTQMCGMANRISHAMDLRGASLTVDTACSASLVALHLACRSLAARESSVAIVGGANLVLGPGLTVMLDAAGALSPDGRCKSFDSTADGYGRGEGAAVVVLKRLADAVRDGDRVHAVVRGSAVHQDGRTNGIMAPSEQAQTHLLHKAYRAAGVRPDTVDYVEAHGTGTAAGDPVEANALGAVLGSARVAGSPCLLGSAKSNIGHLEAGAGVVAVIKAALALQHAVIPPSLHCATPNPAIDWSGNGMRVATETTPWPAAEHPRRAGVSGNGYGGTLAHVVLEQAPAAEREQPGHADGEQAGPWVFPVSGATAAGMRANATALADRLGEERLSPAAVGHTLSTRRAHLSHRASVVATDGEELASLLRGVADGDDPAGTVTGEPVACEPVNPVFVFSGHGSQWVGMGRGLLSTEPAFARALEELGPVFRAELGFTPRAVLEGDALEGVDVIQPVIFAVQVGLCAVWRRYGVEPAAVLGHSVGEIAAAVCAGTMSTLDGARLVCRRSVLLRGVAGEGAMFLTDLPFEETAHRLSGRDDVVAAISAAPRWTVVSGGRAAIDELASDWEARGRVIRRVDSDVAFHSPRLDVLVAGMATAAEDIAHTTPEVPLYRTALRDPRAEPADHQHYWATQLRAPVRFAEAVAAAVEDGHRVFVEVSGHPVVTHSVWEVLFDAGVREGFATGSLRRGTPDRTALLNNVGALHCHGVPVAFEAVFPRREIVDLPTTSWRHRPFWRPSTDAGHRKRALRHDRDSHTLLGGMTTVAAAAAPLRMWETTVDHSSRPYPGGHPVHGVEIIPAAVLLHTFEQAARDCGAESLTDVNLRAPIPLTVPRDLQVSHQDGDLRLASQPADDPAGEESWLTHTTARAEPTPPPRPAPLDLAALRGRCTERLADEHVFTLLDSLDVTAMGFPWRVDELWRSDRPELFAVVSAGSPATTWASVLDAALSLPTAVFPGPAKLRMPAEIARMTVRTEPVSRVAVHIEMVGDTASDTVTVTVADLSGQVAVELHEVRFGVPDGMPEDDTACNAAPATPDWAGLDTAELRDHLVNEVREQVAEQVKLPVEQVSPHKPLLEMGLDSVMTLAIRHRLAQRFPVPVPPTLLWNHPTVTAVADYLAAELPAGSHEMVEVGEA